jgi:gliding motility-associated-like protein
MRQIYYLIGLFLFKTLLLTAQSDYLINPSFEKQTDWEYFPYGWTTCNTRSTPDLQPGQWYVFSPPSDGNSYLGLIMLDFQDGDGPKNEDIVANLLKPFYRDSVYILSVDVANVPDAYVWANKPQQLRISSINSDCSLNEVLVLTDKITHSNWKTYCFTLVPKIKDCNFIKFEIYGDTLQPSYMILDNIKVNIICISGDSAVCKGQQDVTYSLPETEYISDVQWSYSGVGATLTDSSNSIKIDFSDSATSGNLIVKYRFYGSEIRIDTQYIKVETDVPFNADIIQGVQAICQWSQFDYKTTPIENAQSYLWEFSGEDAIVAGISDSIVIYFKGGATSGNLTVSGINACGTGLPSVLPIDIESYPSYSGPISGKNLICGAEENVIYSVAPYENANEYYWYYSGENASLKNLGDTVEITFSENATPGYLYAYGLNNCGAGVLTELYINILTLPANATVINGESTVCQGEENVIYTTPNLENATDYIWEYSGTGVFLKCNGSKVELDYSFTATSGNLIVYGINQCGAGLAALLPITISGTLPDNAGTIIGEDSICGEQSGIIYRIPPILNALSYQWNYTGTGISLNSHGETIEISFSENASSGYLSVTGVNDCGIGINSRLYINVSVLPENAGNISGDSAVCRGQEKVAYIIPLIPHASDYIWGYSGTGITMDINGNNVIIDFSSEATSGNLIVSGSSFCGTGMPSVRFPVNIYDNTFPAGTIAGATEVCLNYNNLYSIEPLENAMSYLWNYTGTDSPLTGKNNSIEIKFPKNFTSGILTVSGINVCGLGEPSPPLYINLSDCGTSIPNAFSPNGDGENDLFIVRGFAGFPELLVFNRLGQKVYESESYQNDWNGNDLDGKELPTDTYWYVMKFSDISEEFKGYIYLKR